MHYIVYSTQIGEFMVNLPCCSFTLHISNAATKTSLPLFNVLIYGSQFIVDVIIIKRMMGIGKYGKCIYFI
jgi:hypothetical protein